MLEVGNCIPHNGERGHCDVEQLVDDLLVEHLPRECWPKSEEVLSDDVKEVLVERVDYQERIPSVSLSSVHEQQRLQELELADGEVGTPGSLLAFFS